MFTTFESTIPRFNKAFVRQMSTYIYIYIYMLFQVQVTFMKFHEKQWLDLAKTSNETNSFRRRNKSPDVHIRAF